MDNFIANLKKFQLPSFSSLKVCFDLGTSNTRIAIGDKGIVLKEPTCLGLNKKIGEFIFFGQEAKRITGKVPDFIHIMKPMVHSIISDFDAEVALIRKFVEKSVNPYISSYSFFRPSFEAMTAVPSLATEIEKKAVEEVFYKMSASRVYLIEKSLASAIGCGYNVFAHKPILIVDMGGGLIEISIISGGGIVTYKALKNAGDHMDKLIYNYVYLKHGLILGEITCEELKINLLNFKNIDKTMIVRGKSLETGLPKSAKIKSADVREALITNFNQILDSVKEVIELSPPEVVDEIYNQGVILTGGVANIDGIDQYFSQELKIESHAIDFPENSVVNGLLRLGQHKEQLHILKLNLP